MNDLERIWLIKMDEGEFTWCDCPDPSDDVDEEDVTEYVLASRLTSASDRIEYLESAQRVDAMLIAKHLAQNKRYEEFLEIAKPPKPEAKP